MAAIRPETVPRRQRPSLGVLGVVRENINHPLITALLAPTAGTEQVMKSNCYCPSKGLIATKCGCQAYLLSAPPPRTNWTPSLQNARFSRACIVAGFDRKRYKTLRAMAMLLIAQLVRALKRNCIISITKASKTITIQTCRLMNMGRSTRW